MSLGATLRLMDFHVFHEYRRLVDEGKASPLPCPDCGETLITRVDKDDEPVLWCIPCDSIMKPGLALYGQIRNVVQRNDKASLS